MESRQGARKKLSKPMLLFSALLARFFQNVLESSVVFVGGLLGELRDKLGKGAP